MVLSDPAFPENPCTGNSSSSRSWCDGGIEMSAGNLPVIHDAFLTLMKFIQSSTDPIAGPESLAWVMRLPVSMGRVSGVLRPTAAKWLL